MSGIDFSRDSLLDDFTIATLTDRYFVNDEKSAQEVFFRATTAFSDSPEMAERMYMYASNLWFMPSTPILSNGGTKRGLPISCFLNYVPDNRIGITGHYTENAFLSSLGGGIGGFWGDIRSDGAATSSGSKSSGSIPFIKVVDSEMLAFSQGHTRRGSYAAYQDISHPECEEFLDIRKPTGGDPNRKCINLHHGVNITDDFMEIIEKKMLDNNFDDSWELIDPKTKQVKSVVKATELWQNIITLRSQTGQPYIHYIDASNRALPQSQKNLGLRVRSSNLCTEIMLAIDKFRTAVCCLSSVNLARYDDWKDHPTFIKDIIRFLDNVITFFIENAPPEMSKATFSASQERSLGLGAMGFHTYLQSKMIPIESIAAMSINKAMFKHIKDQAVIATKELAVERGECPDAQGSGVRNMHLMAVAPNATSSIICGNTSPSIEPIRANVYTHKTLSGSFTVKNKELEKILELKKCNTNEVWNSIRDTEGSVQHLDCLNDIEKEVFKTAMEIDQRWLISLAADRQVYICQGQSLNLFFRPNTSIKYIHMVHFQAWKKGLKSLYYYRSQTAHRAVISYDMEIKTKEIYFNDIKVTTDDECVYCEG